MEFRTLQLILEHCFPLVRLKRIMPAIPAGRDWYEAAAEEILNETPVGAELSNILDSESRPQQSKIRAMKVSELRDNLTFEFLEPGRTLGLILWSLMSDARLSVRNLADQLSKQFSESEPQETPLEESAPESVEEEILLEEMETEETETDEVEPEEVELAEIEEAEPEEMEEVEPLAAEPIEEEIEEIRKPELSEIPTLDRQIAEMDEAQIGQSDADLSSEDDIDLNALFNEIQETGADAKELEEELSQILQEESEASEPNKVQIESEADSSIEPLEINDGILDEVDTFIASLEEGDSDVSIASEDRGLIDELNVETILEGVKFDDVGDAQEEQVEDNTAAIGKEIREESIDLAAPVEEIPSLETVEPLDDAESLEEFEVEETVAAPMQKNDTPVHLPVPTVQLGGITISLSSLKRACESVFNEPVELVTDENLTLQDQIVVVGRNCGVRILHGPTWTQPLQPFRERSEEPITINPTSLQLALSRIHGEPVELIPDPNLLSGGVILFAGRTTGLGIMENLRISVPMPDWSHGKIETPEKTAVTEQLVIGMADELADLREQIAMLKSRIQSLETAPPPAPVYIQQDFPTPKPELAPAYKPEPLPETVFEAVPESIPELVPEPVPAYQEEAVVTEPEIAVEELEDVEQTTDAVQSEVEPESYEPESLEPEPVEEEIQIAIAEPETMEPQEESSASDDLPLGDIDDINLEELSLNEMTEDIVDRSLGLETKETVEEDIQLDLGESKEETDEFNLEDLELGVEGGDSLSLEDIASLDLEAEKKEDPDSPSVEEINLEDFDLDSLENLSFGDEEEEPKIDLLEEITKETKAETGQGESALEGAGSEENALDEFNLEDVDLDDILSELDSEETDSTVAPKPVFHGETILLLGGERKNQKEYKRVVEEIGGNCLWYANLNEMPEGEIADLVERANLVMTLTADAISDPGILQATNYAEEQKKMVIQHYSSSPVSVQKQLIKAITEK